MIWLDVTEENGRALYLDICGIKSRRQQGGTVYVISGVLGDGQDEADVMLEVGNGVAVTFPDEWLYSRRRLGLFSRVDREKLIGSLVEAASGMSFCREKPLTTTPSIPIIQPVFAGITQW